MGVGFNGNAACVCGLGGGGQEQRHLLQTSSSHARGVMLVTRLLHLALIIMIRPTAALASRSQPDPLSPPPLSPPHLPPQRQLQPHQQPYVLEVRFKNLNPKPHTPNPKIFFDFISTTPNHHRPPPPHPEPTETCNTSLLQTRTRQQTPSPTPHPLPLPLSTSPHPPPPPPSGLVANSWIEPNSKIPTLFPKNLNQNPKPKP